MMSFGTFVMLVVIVVVLVLLVSAGSRNRTQGPAPQRGCGHCGAAHPHFAAFCRRCGKRLG